MNFTIGADPEVFAVDANGNLRSCIGIIGGSKEQPKWLDEHQSLGVQEDNVAAEYCFAPCTNEEQFIQAIEAGKSAIQSLLKCANLQIHIAPSGIFPDEELKHPMAQVFGCDPDFDAWNLQQNPKPSHPNKNFRTCGGHIHVGIPNFNTEDPMEYVKLTRLMDLHVGLWSVIEDDDAERANLYGGPGAFRPKPYGVEYRTLSNYWINNKHSIRSIFSRVSKCVNHFNDTKQEILEDWKIYEAIKSKNKSMAFDLIESYGI